MLEEPTQPLALAGLRVLDLSWIIAGPICTKMLADQGAEVIKLESFRSMDPVRQSGPWLHGVRTAPDGGGVFTLFNRNKLSATLNLQTEQGRELFKRLVAQSDVVVNNYSAGTMERLGLGYAVLAEVNPKVIVLEISAMGQAGPLSSQVAFGQVIMAQAGSYQLLGEPGRDPVLPGYTLADFAGGAFGALAVAAAVHRRKTTGHGEHIDMSLFEVVVALNSEAVLATELGLGEPHPPGNHNFNALLHGCFACVGNDRWCTVAAWTFDEWEALRGVVCPHEHRARLHWDAARFAESRAHLEGCVSNWTAIRTHNEAAEALQAVGVEAAPVEDIRDMMDGDEHLRFRQYFESTTHPFGDEVQVDGIPFKMSASPGRVRHPGPVFGADNDYVFLELLGLTQEEMAGLRHSGVIE